MWMTANVFEALQNLLYLTTFGTNPEVEIIQKIFTGGFLVSLQENIQQYINPCPAEPE